jgi:hypothetical protein
MYVLLVRRARQEAKKNNPLPNGAEAEMDADAGGGSYSPSVLRVQVPPGPVGLMLGDRLPSAGVTITEVCWVIILT